MGPSAPSPARPAPQAVFRAEGLTKVYGERVIMQDVDFSLPPGGIVGVIGGNGAGKTTLFKMITGQEEATSGSLQIGDSVDVAYVDQFRDDLDPDIRRQYRVAIFAHQGKACAARLGGGPEGLMAQCRCSLPPSPGGVAASVSQSGGHADDVRFARGSAVGVE